MLVGNVASAFRALFRKKKTEDPCDPYLSGNPRLGTTALDKVPSTPVLSPQKHTSQTPHQFLLVY